jgi:hypothetical protein
VYNGTVVASSVVSYKPFGTPVSQSGSDTVRYAGELTDPAANSSPGLYYIGARWMDPERLPVNGKRNKGVCQAGPALSQLD